MTRRTDLWRNRPFPVKIGALLVALAVSANCGIARAQPAVPALTVLHLSATGSVQVAPDQLMAEAVSRLGSFQQSRWFKLVWIVPAILVGLALLVIAARAIRDTAGGQPVRISLSLWLHITTDTL